MYHGLISRGTSRQAWVSTCPCKTSDAFHTIRGSIAFSGYAFKSKTKSGPNPSQNRRHSHLLLALVLVFDYK